MKLSEFLYVGNWKMQIPFKDTISFCWNHKDEMEKLSARENVHVVLCPSFDALHLVAQVFDKTEVSVGAQNCSTHESGPFTGQVSACSIAQVGCEFCIVGHSERRNLFSETNDDVAKKIQQALKNGLYPIICVGETKQEREQDKTEEVIRDQMASACEAIQEIQAEATVCFAYEPVWAIGSGVVPENKQIERVFEQMSAIIGKMAPEAHAALLYGGSVNDQNAKKLKEIAGIGGFLIGGASLDFQKFEKIVI